MRRPENAYHVLQLQPISCNCLHLSSRNFSSLLSVFRPPLGRTNCSVLNKILRFNGHSSQRPLTAFREAGNGTGRCIFREHSQGFIVPCSAIKLLPFLKYAKKRWHSFACRNSHHHKGVCALTSVKEERNTISHNPENPTVTAKKRSKYGVLPEEPLAVTGHGDLQILPLNQGCFVASKRTKTLECTEGGCCSIINEDDDWRKSLSEMVCPS